MSLPPLFPALFSPGALLWHSKNFPHLSNVLSGFLSRMSAPEEQCLLHLKHLEQNLAHGTRPITCLLREVMNEL